MTAVRQAAHARAVRAQVPEVATRLQDVLGLCGDQYRWRLIAEMGIHPAEPRADRLRGVVLEEQADDLIRVPKATLGIRVR